MVVGAIAAIGAVATRLLLPWLRQLELGPNLALFMADVSLDRTVLAVSVLVALVSGVFAGVLPAWFSRNADLTDALRSGSRTATLSPAALRWQQAMVFGQAALSVVIIATAALIGVSFQNLNRIAIGIRAPGAVVARVQPQDKDYGTHERQVARRLATLCSGISRRRGRTNAGSPFAYVATWRALVYVAFVIDVFSRRIVGWRASRSMSSERALVALGAALCDRDTECSLDPLGYLPPAEYEAQLQLTNSGLAELVLK